MFEAPPTRKLIVPKGVSAWWGVDPGTRRVAIASISREGERRGWEVPIPALDGGERLAAIFMLTSMALRELLQERWDLLPGVVLVEQPSGAQANPSLSYATGAIMAAVSSVVGAFGAKVETVPSGKWKKLVCGHGGIKKPKPNSSVEYPVLGWARGMGYSGVSWDVADAWAIAEYARRTFVLEQRQSL